MDKENYFDFVILGAGIYGFYASFLLAKKNLNIALIECDNEVFKRASDINQRRVHKGYHYLRSVSTAKSSAKYFNRFCDDFKPAIHSSFKKIYAVSNRNSYTSHRQFLKFCEFCQIPVLEINPSIYFNDGTIEGAYETEEFAFDSDIIKEILLQKVNNFNNFKLFMNKRIIKSEKDDKFYYLTFEDGTHIKTKGVFNCTYASVNQVLSLFGFELFDLKYEICEVILCSVNQNLKNVGITVMDGPFFSTMPYGKCGLHSLTAVEFTPHDTSYNKLPTFKCQKTNKSCTPIVLQNCNTCKSRPKESYVYMRQLAKKYMKPSYEFEFKESLFSIKPIMLSSEIDDSRPTLIKIYNKSPLFISVLSGKINTIYELEDIINGI
ncbi:MAG: amino acid oxidase [Elusimicrobia bacterium RIFOXYC2_FULL_34_12]|nr:MAG: amino acid oxidase [Elusimicrobia bacterium RIFOXYC2_FULL_34_12]